jgi:hypothetical protein
MALSTWLKYSVSLQIAQFTDDTLCQLLRGSDFSLQILIFLSYFVDLSFA